jgi:hypothetical protein
LGDTINEISKKFWAMIREYTRPWFARTVYDKIENLGRLKQIIPLSRKQSMEDIPEKFKLTHLTPEHAESWVRLFPRKIKVWESRKTDVQEPNNFDSSILLRRAKPSAPVRPEVTIKSPQMVVSFTKSKPS